MKPKDYKYRARFSNERFVFADDHDTLPNLRGFGDRMANIRHTKIYFEIFVEPYQKWVATCTFLGNRQLLMPWGEVCTMSQDYADVYRQSSQNSEKPQ